MAHFLRLLFTPFISLISFTVSAQIKLPALISDGMVLQQNSKAALWGWASPGEKITIKPSWSSKTVSVITGKDGKWTASLPTLRAGGPYTILFSGSNAIRVNNVLLGEVWLASGQSNMEFFVGKMSNPSYTGVINYAEVMKDAEHPGIRMIDVPNKVEDEPQSDFKGEWRACSAATIDSFSAVAYFFALEIHKATGFPVGIINSTWGGTPAEAWTKKEILEQDSGLSVILRRYEKAIVDYPAENEKYKASLASWRSDTSTKKGAAPRAPMGPKSNQSPSKLYNGMIAPLIPYTLKGVIWYQGESNAGRAWQYRRLFPAMIANWRSDFKNRDLPFYFVQISPHRSQNPEIRDAQLEVLYTVPHTGMAVTTDNGDSLDIHPRNKELVGKRLSLWALHNQYGKKNIITSGPLYRSMTIEGNKIRIYFDQANGLTMNGDSLKEFSIAGDDRQFVPARALIEGNTVVVWSDSVKEPKAVRFAWRNIPEPNLFNSAGLPASPFRTDNWKLPTEGIN